MQRKPVRQFVEIDSDYLAATLRDWETAALRRLAHDLPDALKRELNADLPAAGLTSAATVP